MANYKINQERKQFLDDIVAQGYSRSTACYHWCKQQKGKTTKHLKYKPWSRSILDRNGIYVETDPTATYGYRVYKSNNYGTYELCPYLDHINHVVFGVYGYRTDDSEKCEQFTLPLAVAAYVYFVRDVPVGFVIDHIDENPLNNDLSNLQCITRSENVKRRTKRYNQFTVPKKENK